MSNLRKNIKVAASTFFSTIAVVGLAFFFLNNNKNTSEKSRFTSVTTTDTTHSQDRALPQQALAIKLPTYLSFAGEDVPLDNFDTRERLDRELLIASYQHSATIGEIKLAQRYFPVIEPILARMGVPDDFKYLAVAESSLRHASSPAGAKGIWQFMESAAKQYNLVINDEVDERYHIQKATEAACRYLIECRNDLGSWTLAAAAYNMGKVGVKNKLAEQKENNYYDMMLNAETDRYVFRILAEKSVIESPEKYGFYVFPEDYYPPFATRTISVDNEISSLADFAHQQGTTYRMLKVYNPWLRNTALHNRERHTYNIELP